MGNKASVTVENEILKISYGGRTQKIPLENMESLLVHNVSRFIFKYNDGSKILHKTYEFSPCCLLDPKHDKDIIRICIQRKIPVTKLLTF